MKLFIQSLQLYKSTYGKNLSFFSLFINITHKLPDTLIKFLFNKQKKGEGCADPRLLYLWFIILIT